LAYNSSKKGLSLLLSIQALLLLLQARALPGVVKIDLRHVSSHAEHLDQRVRKRPAVTMLQAKADVNIPQRHHYQLHRILLSHSRGSMDHVLLVFIVYAVVNFVCCCRLCMILLTILAACSCCVLLLVMNAVAEHGCYCSMRTLVHGKVAASSRGLGVSELGGSISESFHHLQKCFRTIGAPFSKRVTECGP
jgi:hypothetical protein